MVKIMGLALCSIKTSANAKSEGDHFYVFIRVAAIWCRRAERREREREGGEREELRDRRGIGEWYRSVTEPR